MTDPTPGPAHVPSPSGAAEPSAVSDAPEPVRATEPPTAHNPSPYVPSSGAPSSGAPSNWAPEQNAPPTGWTQQGQAVQPQIHNQQFQYSTPGQPMYAAPTSPPTPQRGRSIASMWIGIGSIFFGFTIVLPVVGLVLGIIGWKAEPDGKGTAIAGVILNSLVLLFFALIAALAIFGYFALGIAGGFIF